MNKAGGWLFAWPVFGLAVVLMLGAPMRGEAAEQGVPVLRMAKQWTDPVKDCGGTIWRYHETWQTDVVKDDGGALVRVEPGVWRKKAAGGNDKTGPFELVPAKKVVGAEFPAAGWEQPDFDDSEWTRNPGQFDGYYRSLAMIALRGKFAVSEPASAPAMELTVSFQGGAVVYLNGKEIGREGLPAGKITNETLANDYPKETDAGGSSKQIFGLIAQVGNGEVFHKDAADKLWGVGANDKVAVAEHYRQRFRTVQVKVPASVLRKGVNVLAIEVHRAPAHPIMFLAPYGIWDIMKFAWNRCLVDDILLTAKSANGLVPNVARPAGVQVWNASLLNKLLPSYFGDPNEVGLPIRLAGTRNGTFSGQFVVSSTTPIKGFGVSVTDLKSKEGQTIPAAAVVLGFAQWDACCVNFDMTGIAISSGRCALYNTLDLVAPKEIAAGTMAANIGGIKVPSYPAAMQPICVSVRVPKDAKAGEYAGKITVVADGKNVEVPLRVTVAGEWALPEPQKFKTFVGMVESPDSVALKYNVKMWSEEHWKLLDKVFALMGEVGVDDLYIPMLAKSNLGNEESMVKWVQQGDGSVKPDFSIVERYLDLATKYLGKQLCVVCWVHELPFSRGGSSRTWAGKSIAINRGDPSALAGGFPIPYTKVDAAGKAADAEAPQWGTPESKAFWKPVVEGMKAVLAKRGMEKTLVFGCATDGAFIPPCKSDFQALAPDVHWYSRAHHVFNIKELSYFNWGCYPLGGSDVMVVNWSPDTGDTGYYRWRAPAWKTSFPIVTGAWSMNMVSEPVVFRVMAESILVHKDRGGGEIVHGIGCQGADYWPVLTPSKGDCPYNLSRYTDQCGNMDHFSATYAFLGAGKDVPAATGHLRLLQESLQDMEARIFVQDAVLDQKDKLGADLGKRCHEVCNERTRRLYYYSLYMESREEYREAFPHEAFDEAWYRQNTEQLYALAGEVAKALGQ